MATRIFPVMRIQLLRHATLVLHFDGIHVLVDPMLADAGAMDPVANAARADRIPLVPLPLAAGALEALLAEVDAVLVTHLHRDHWDAAAAARVPTRMPILCQPGDAERLRGQGFTQVIPVDDELHWRSLRMVRTDGRHGQGEVGQRMGAVSGFVVDAPGAPRLWIAGDTVWCPEVEAALSRHRPAVVVLNAGAAQFLTGGPITMDADDVVRVCRAAPAATVVVVHFEAVNHCLLTRDALRRRLLAEGIAERVRIPADGETLTVA